jgi:putative transposase
MTKYRNLWNSYYNISKSGNGIDMIPGQLKLKLTKKQETAIIMWLPMLTSMWNRAIRKIELDARGKIYYTPEEFQNFLPLNSKIILGMLSHALQGMVSLAHQSWRRCSQQNISIPFPDPLGTPANNTIKIPNPRMGKYHKHSLPEGRVKCGRIVKRASDWYLYQFIDAAPSLIPSTGVNIIGIGPRYKHLLTILILEKVDHPKEAQWGGNKKLSARLNERISKQWKDDTHRLSRQPLSENKIIALSKDYIRGLFRADIGRSFAAVIQGQLRSMLSCKSRIGCMQCVEFASKGSTRTCPSCCASTGPQGRAGLSVRQGT